MNDPVMNDPVMNDPVMNDPGRYSDFSELKIVAEQGRLCRQGSRSE